MKSIICSLYNKTTGHYSVPLVFENKEQAVHTFISEIQAEKSELANIKDALSIYAIGTFDHKAGRIQGSLKTKKSQLLISGKEVTLNTPKETL